MSPAFQQNNQKKAEKKGRKAELLAIWLLRLQGYRIQAKRFRCPVGEVDIIASRGTTLVAVEVKSRANLDAALESLRPQQCQRIEKALVYWLQKQANPNRSVSAMNLRFDLIAVAGPLQFTHIKNAWLSSGF